MKVIYFNGFKLMISDRSIRTFAEKAHGVIVLSKLVKIKLKKANRTANPRFFFVLLIFK